MPGGAAAVPAAIRTTPYTTQPYSILQFLGFTEMPGSPNMALRNQSIVSLGGGRYQWNSQVANVGTGNVRWGAVRQVAVRAVRGPAKKVTDFAYRLPPIFPRDLEPGQSVDVSAIVTIPRSVKRLAFTVDGRVIDGRGEVLSFAAGQTVMVPH